MLLAIGTRVKFLHTQDEGVVTALLDDGMVMVHLTHDNMEIPAFVDDLIRAEDVLRDAPPVKARIIPGKKEKTPPPAPERPDIETQYTIIKSRGIQLACDPVYQADGAIGRYTLFLLNDTPYDVLFSFSLQLRDSQSRRQNGKLPALSYLQVGELLFDQLNDAPVADIECWRITTEGTGSRLSKQLRIKPKNFFSRTVTAPLLNRQVHLFRLFEDPKASSHQQQQEEDLRSYTLRQTRPSSSSAWNDIVQRFPHDVVEFAEFVPEIDLHIECLRNDHQKLGKGEILRIQLNHFEAYINKAIRLGVERVFIIHGVGMGRLRDAIAGRLIQIPEVITFKNEYHPRYGWGATEVILQE